MSSEGHHTPLLGKNLKLKIIPPLGVQILGENGPKSMRKLVFPILGGGNCKKNPKKILSPPLLEISSFFTVFLAVLHKIDQNLVANE